MALVDATPEASQNLIDCPDCHHKVSRLAVACPGCARPLRDPIAVAEAVQAPPDFRWGASVGGGLLILLFASFHAGYWNAMWMPWLAGLAGAVWVGKSKFRAWPNAWLTCTILTFLVPISATVHGVRGMDNLAGLEGEAAAAGAAVGTVIGVAALGFLALFVGLALSLVTWFTFRSARERESRCRAAGIQI